MKQCKSFRNGQVFCFTGRWGAVGLTVTVQLEDSLCHMCNVCLPPPPISCSHQGLSREVIVTLWYNLQGGEIRM